MFFVTHRKIFYTLIGILSVISVVALIVWRLVFGIEFTGGTIVEVAYVGERPEKAMLEENFNTLDLGQYSLRLTDEYGYIIRLRYISDYEYQSFSTVFTV